MAGKIITVGEIIEKLLKEDGVTIYNVNNNLQQVSRANGKRRPAYVKLAISDGDAEKLIRAIQPAGAQAFMIVADIDVVNRLFDEMKQGVPEPPKEVQP